MTEREPWTVWVTPSGVRAVQTDHGPLPFLETVHGERVAEAEAKRAALRRPAVYGQLPDGYVPSWMHHDDLRDEVDP
jgi:hypothetical protein